MIEISTFYIKSEQIDGENISIIGNDVKHIKNVLRYKVDDELEVCDENEGRYKTRITRFLEEEILLEIPSLSFKVSMDNGMVALEEEVENANSITGKYFLIKVNGFNRVNANNKSRYTPKH